MPMTPLEEEVAALREEMEAIKTAFRAWGAMIATAVDYVPLTDADVAEMERDQPGGHPIIHPINGCGPGDSPAPPGPLDPPD